MSTQVQPNEETITAPVTANAPKQLESWEEAGISAEFIEQYWTPRWSWNAAANFSVIEQMGERVKSLDAFIGKHTGETAIITGGGPSLDKNIETLKRANHLDYTLFSCTSTLNPLIRHGLAPTYVVCNDAQPWVSALHFAFLSEVHMQRATLVGMTTLHPNTLKGWKGDVALYSDLNPTNPLLFDHGPLHSMYPDITRIPCAACVTNVSVRIAALMGFKYILMIGADLAFTDGMQRCTKYWRDRTGEWRAWPSEQVCEPTDDGSWRWTDHGQATHFQHALLGINGQPSSGEYLFYQEDLLGISKLSHGFMPGEQNEATLTQMDFTVINCTEGGAIVKLPAMPVDEAIAKAKAGQLGNDINGDGTDRINDTDQDPGV